MSSWEGLVTPSTGKDVPERSSTDWLPRREQADRGRRGCLFLRFQPEADSRCSARLLRILGVGVVLGLALITGDDTDAADVGQDGGISFTVAFSPGALPPGPRKAFGALRGRSAPEAVLLPFEPL